MKLPIALSALTAILIAVPAAAGPEAFKTGPLIEGHGENAAVPAAAPLPADAHFRIAFDVAEKAEDGKANRRINSAARFLNMHVAAGTPAENLQIAIVVHGPAVGDLLNDEAFGGVNPSAGLISALIDHGVSIEMCGQTAAYRDISQED
ncbi:MAG: DsrE family protein, partial [Pseudomonadota bacterium]